ncbi:Tfp pilus assembly protein FimT/FimU [Deinococcus frigens]|uniref:pilus assembly FimT family protein n=1 Tax=Deinococcus frigens TaxID=249403 RepID=UPI000497F2A5|nr:type II secretion system protein [Deinococcus frigens]
MALCSVQGGFTLVELLIAVGLVLVMIAVILPTLTQTFQVNRTAVSAQAVTGYAKSVIEQTSALWLTRDSTPGATDPYPWLSAGTLPVLQAAPTGVTCQPPSSLALGAASPLGRRRLTVTCSTAANGTLTFIMDIGRP